MDCPKVITLSSFCCTICHGGNSRSSLSNHLGHISSILEKRLIYSIDSILKQSTIASIGESLKVLKFFFSRMPSKFFAKFLFLLLAVKEF